MKLVTIGRSPSCTIVYNSQAVSALHAELVILNNGDILLTDKNSSNGTFVFGKPIKPETEVSIRRGDPVRFADKELNWAAIPPSENLSNYKCIYGIGSNYRNEIQLPGTAISRYHATLKITKDKKVYIEDHSTNGTTVNGVKIRSGENVRLKRKDIVLCGGEQVDIAKYIPGSLWDKSKFIIATLATAAAVFAGFLFINPDPGPKLNPSMLIPATLYVHAKYNIVVTLDDDPFINEIEGWPREWVFGSGNNNELVLDFNGQAPFGYSGTAFFISHNGIMGTNRHIALPWEYLDKSITELINQRMEQLKQQQLSDEENSFLYTKLYNHLLKLRNEDPKKFYQKCTEIDGWKARFYKSTLKISGRMIYMAVGYPNRNYHSEQEFVPCSVLKVSDDPKKDIALLQLNDKKTPEDIPYIYAIENARTDIKTLQPQGEDMYTIGYPAGLRLGLNNEDGGLKPTIHKVSISKEPGEYDFEFQGEELGGASGSPIVDRTGHLVGVLWGGYAGTATFGTACLIRHIKELYDKTNTK